MSTKALSPLIVTAMAVVSDYSAAVPKQNEAFYVQAHRAENVNKLQATITELTAGWNEVEDLYRSILRKVSDSHELDDRLYLSNMESLKAVRQLEAVLASAPAPAALDTEHMELRRAIARARGRLAAIDLLCRQFFMKPEVFDSVVNPEGLRALADHTTQRLVRLA